MSRGFEAYAKLKSDEESYVIYSYGSHNWNDERHMNREGVYDGTIKIAKSCFGEKYPSGMYEDGRIEVTNCSNCWHKTEDEDEIDYMVLRLVSIIFDEYEEKGIQESVSFMV